MSRYEVLLLTVPEITQDEAVNLESQLQNVIKKEGAAVLSFERWGKYRLAYPVNKNDYGVYFLVRFETEVQPSALLNGIRSLFAVDQRNIVMRSVTSALDSAGSLEYRRPPSLEETPPKEAGFTGRGEGRGWGEGRGRPGSRFSRGPRSEGLRSEHGHDRRRTYAPVSEEKDEFDAGQDMTNEEAAQ